MLTCIPMLAAHLVTVWPWPVTFWPYFYSTASWTIVCQVWCWLLKFFFLLECRQTDTHAHTHTKSKMPLITLPMHDRLPLVWAITEHMIMLHTNSVTGWHNLKLVIFGAADVPAAVNKESPCQFQGDRYCLGNAGTDYMVIILISHCLHWVILHHVYIDWNESVFAEQLLIVVALFDSICVLFVVWFKYRILVEGKTCSVYCQRLVFGGDSAQSGD